MSELGYAGAVRLSGGLLLMGLRVYSPAIRGFLQTDPLLPFKYDYTDGDPVNRVDPTGMRNTDANPTMPTGQWWANWHGQLGWTNSSGVSNVWVNPAANGTVFTVVAEGDTWGSRVNPNGSVTVSHPPGTPPPTVTTGPGGQVFVEWPSSTPGGGGVDSFWLGSPTRSFGGEFTRSFWSGLDLTAEGMATLPGRAGKLGVGAITSGAMARELRVVATPLSAAAIAVREVVFATEASGPFLSFVLRDALVVGVVNGLVGTAVFWGGAVFTTGFVAAADGMYATTVDSVHTVLSRGRY